MGWAFMCSSLRSCSYVEELCHMHSGRGSASDHACEASARLSSLMSLLSTHYMANIQRPPADYDVNSISGTCGIGAHAASVAQAASVPAALAVLAALLLGWVD